MPSESDKHELRELVRTNEFFKTRTGELFMLMPSQQLAEGSNQLAKVPDENMCLIYAS